MPEDMRHLNYNTIALEKTGSLCCVIVKKNSFNVRWIFQPSLDRWKQVFPGQKFEFHVGTG